MAFIMSQHNGENSIIINGAANMAYGDTLHESWYQTIAESNVLLL